MKGTLVNVAAIAIGSVAGLLLQKGIEEKYQKIVLQALGLAVLVIGFQMAEKSLNILIVILSLAIGALIGEWLDLDGKLNQFGAQLGAKFSSGDAGRFSEGFVTASLMYCVGAMAIVGALQDGLTGDSSTLYAKSLLDGVSSVVFSSTLGIGVLFSAASVFVYQGAITLMASVVSSWLSNEMIAEMTATGGVLIIAISINMLEITKIKIASLLPAILIALLIARFWV